MHPVEELLQLHVHNYAPARLEVRLSRTNGLMRTAARTEPVAVLAEGGIKQGLQHLQQGLLNQPIRHRRDTQLTLASIRLRAPNPTHPLWPARPTQQLLADRGPLPHQALGCLVDSKTVH